MSMYFSGMVLYLLGAILVLTIVEDVEYGSPLILALTWPIISVLVILFNFFKNSLEALT